MLRFLSVILIVFSAPVSAQNCSLPDQYNINCNFSGVSPEQAIQELAQVIATAEVDQVVRQSAQQMLPFLNDEMIAANPNAALLAFVALGNSIREDDYWERALAIVVAGQAAAPTDNRDYLEFVARYMHSQRMAGAYDRSAQAARATYGSTVQPSGGRQLPGYGSLDLQRHDGHIASIQLIEAWEGRSPLDSELLILHALEGDPQAQFLIGQHLAEKGTHRGLNLSRVTTRTGHFVNGPFDADRGLQFLEAAFAAGVTEAGPILERYRAEASRLAEEERITADAAAAEQAERERIAQEAREAREAEAAEQDLLSLVGAPGPYKKRDTRLDNLVDAAADTLVRELCQRAEVLPSSGGFLMTGGRIYYANNYCTMKSPTGASSSYYVSRIDILGCTGRRCNVRVTLSCGARGLLMAADCADFNRGYSRDGTALMAEDGIGVEAFRIEL
ncbi:hypothetical protein GCM10016455_28310 [Aliiroseovarius zhejiangensis]|uniref:Sel1 repeat family protein n=1 Tax=Aliiroseovarius zhejiangensis TaxID=1632025 RepID=A0ABQ3J6P4_9RHOB|nr:hypothetical protein GCM10016455_28310 [Aliiroseovarius zhejiangensis]